MINDLIKGLPDQFNPKIQGRVLIIDGDSLAYKAAATSKRLKTAIRKFQMMCLEKMFITQAETARVHLTHRDSLKTNRHRVLAWKPYQDNRKDSERPVLIEELRDAVSSDEHVLPEYSCTLHKILEADDAVMIDSYAYKESGVLYSEDKDLRQTPHPMYDPYRGVELQADGIGSLWMHVTPSGNYDIHGCGRLFFWAQMLRGDGADNIRGLDRFYGRQIGAVRTLEELEVFNDAPAEVESEVANFVLDAYRHHNQNPLPEGWLLHMLRTWDDSFNDVLQSLDLSTQNTEFLNECTQQHWFD